MPTTTISINVRDPRDRKALAYFREAESWGKCHVRCGDGVVRKAYGIRSISDPSVYHLTNRQQCNCPDFQYRQDGRGFACAHIRAVRWYVEYVRMEQRKEEAREAEIASRASQEKPPLVDAF